MVIILLAVIGTGGYFAWRKGKLTTKAETTSPTVEVQLASFANDVRYNHWAYKYMEAVTRKKFGPNQDQAIINKYPDGTFRPDLLIDRASLAVFAARTLNILPCDTCAQDFADVPRSNWAFGYIEALYHYNQSSSRPDGLFSCRPMPGYTWCFLESSRPQRNFYPAAGSDPSNPIYGYGLTTVLFYNTGRTYSYPTTAYNDNSPLTRVLTAALITYNFHLPADDPVPTVYFHLVYPEDSPAGFDFGYEVWRKGLDGADDSLIWVEEPPKEGVQTEPSLSPAYDRTVVPGKTYTYDINIFDREGFYVNSVEVQISI